MGEAAVFKVKSVIKPDTFEIYPKWSLDNINCSFIIIRGLNCPQAYEKEFLKAKDKLCELILNEDVHLKNPTILSYGRIYCDVFLNGKNILDLF